MDYTPERAPRRARLILWFAAALFVLAGIFPPWCQVVNIPYRAHSEQPLGYSFIAAPPARDMGARFAAVASVRIDFGRLVVEWVVVAGAAVLLSVATAQRRRTP